MDENLLEIPNNASSVPTSRQTLTICLINSNLDYRVLVLFHCGLEGLRVGFDKPNSDLSFGTTANYPFTVGGNRD